jgi:flavin reductase (DIM6/NTAB) family NADH-FMN oxidoreductase RutF
MTDQFNEIEIKSLQGNFFHKLDNEWMLITAGTGELFNLMTASWGTFGILWNVPVAIAFIRPHRHTFGFVEKNSQFTLSFLGNDHKEILNYCGLHSGRAVDKVKETGLIPLYTPSGSISFEQAKLIIECRKIYSDDIKAEKFINKEIILANYPAKDFHRLFIGEIIHCFENKSEYSK